MTLLKIASGPLVSVIIPLYNCEKYVGAAIESVLGQTYAHFEIIVIDDGSTDGSRDAVKPYLDKITYLEQSNQGSASARNAGVRRAKGELVAFLDADDLWLPNRLEIQVPLFSDPDIGLVHAGVRTFESGSNGHISDANDVPAQFKSGNILGRLLRYNIVCTQSVMVRKECFDKAGLFDESLRAAQDYDLWLRICRQFRAKYVPQVVARYRIHGRQISDKFDLTYDCERKVIEKFYAHYPENDAVKNLSKNERLSDIYFRCGHDYFFVARDLVKARENFRKALDFAPSNRSARFYWVLSHLSPSVYNALFRFKIFLSSANAVEKKPGKKNLMFVTFSLDIGGIETLILEICRRIDRDKYAPSVCSFFDNGGLAPEFVKSGIPVYTVAKKRELDWSLPFRLAALFKKHEVDLVHTHNPSVWLYGGIAAKICGIPLVHTAHSSSDYNVDRWKKIEYFLSFFTDKITSVSKYVADYMIGEEGISNRKIQVILNGVKIEDYQNETDAMAMRSQCEVKEGDFVFVNVARLTPVKDHRTLLKAFSIVVKKAPGIKLLIVGDGPLKSDLLNEAEKLGLKDQVRFLGYRRDIPALLKSFDAFVLSSEKESLPIVLLEAMASGLPVISTKVGGSPEIVENGVTGLLVPSKDPEAMAEAMCALKLKGDLARQMGEKGKQRVREHFTFERMVQQYYALYDSIAVN